MVFSDEFSHCTWTTPFLFLHVIVQFTPIASRVFLLYNLYYFSCLKMYRQYRFIKNWSTYTYVKPNFRSWTSFSGDIWLILSYLWQVLPFTYWVNELLLLVLRGGYVVSGRAGSVAPHRRVLTGLRKLGAEYRTRFAPPLPAHADTPTVSVSLVRLNDGDSTTLRL